MNRIALFIVSLILLGGCSKDETPTSCPVCVNPLVDSVARVLVTKVSDGDTFSFIERGEEIKVRVLGIDCFETRHGSRLTEQATAAGISEDSALALGFEAKALADSLLMNEQVELYRDSVEDNFDPFGRLLRHVYVTIEGRRVNYQDTIISLGLSIP
jgi:endonuclease YncB( thermonuclease family)